MHRIKTIERPFQNKAFSSRLLLNSIKFILLALLDFHLKLPYCSVVSFPPICFRSIVIFLMNSLMKKKHGFLETEIRCL